MATQTIDCPVQRPDPSLDDGSHTPPHGDALLAPPGRPGAAREEASAVTDKQEFNRVVRRTAVTTVALVFGLLFGIILLVGGDRIPGGIIVAAALSA